MQDLTLFFILFLIMIILMSGISLYGRMPKNKDDYSKVEAQPQLDEQPPRIAFVSVIYKEDIVCSSLSISNDKTVTSYVHDHGKKDTTKPTSRSDQSFCNKDATLMTVHGAKNSSTLMSSKSDLSVYSKDGTLLT